LSHQSLKFCSFSSRLLIQRAEPFSWVYFVGVLSYHLQFTDLLSACLALDSLSKRRAQVEKSIEQGSRLLITELRSAKPELALRCLPILLGVTAGRLALEADHAEMTILHATLAEAAQGIEAAVKIVMELAPEAVSSITPRERAIYLLQQVRFLVDAGDFVRAAIVANKVPRSVIDCDEHVDAAAYFHRVSVDIAAAQRDGDAFTAHRHKAARALLRAHARATPFPFPDLPVSLRPTLSPEAVSLACDLAVSALVVSPPSPSVRELAAAVVRDARSVRKEVDGAGYSADARRLAEQVDALYMESADAVLAHPLVCRELDAAGQALSEKVRLFCFERNIVRLAQVCSRVTLDLLAVRSGAGEAVERVLRDASRRGTLSALGIRVQIDRPTGYVAFVRPSSVSGTLDAWSGTLDGILDSVSLAGHLIDLEREEIA
jgi:hypothetical protein